MGQYMATQFHRMIHSCVRMPAKWPEEMLVRRGLIFNSIRSRVETETAYEASQDVTTFWWMRGSLGLQVASSADRPLIGRLATNLEVEIPTNKHINTYPSTILPHYSSLNRNWSLRCPTALRIVLPSLEHLNSLNSR